MGLHSHHRCHPSTHPLICRSGCGGRIPPVCVQPNSTAIIIPLRSPFSCYSLFVLAARAEEGGGRIKTCEVPWDFSTRVPELSYLLQAAWMSV